MDLKSHPCCEVYFLMMLFSTEKGSLCWFVFRPICSTSLWSQHCNKCVASWWYLDNSWASKASNFNVLCQNKTISLAADRGNKTLTGCSHGRSAVQIKCCFLWSNCNLTTVTSGLIKFSFRNLSTFGQWLVLISFPACDPLTSNFVLFFYTTFPAQLFSAVGSEGLVLSVSS